MSSTTSVSEADVRASDEAAEKLAKELSKRESKKQEKPMNVAMKLYLEKKRQYDAFMVHERAEYELGRRHLANMMGTKVEDMTQDQIDQSIEYLFPSGLRDPAARPMFKPPDEVWYYKEDYYFTAIDSFTE